MRAPQAEIETLQAVLNANSKKEAVLIAVQLALHLAVEARKGNQFFVGLQRLIMLVIEKPEIKGWMFFAERAHPWKKQLYIKGRKLPASVVWSEMQANKLTVDDAMENWDLPKEVILEVLQIARLIKICSG